MIVNLLALVAITCVISLMYFAYALGSSTRRLVRYIRMNLPAEHKNIFGSNKKSSVEKGQVLLSNFFPIQKLYDFLNSPEADSIPADIKNHVLYYRRCFTIFFSVLAGLIALFILVVMVAIFLWGEPV